MNYLRLEIICWSCLLIAMAVSTEAASVWKLPTAQMVYEDLEKCRQESLEEDAHTLRCLVKKLGLWTDESGYNARRIAKIFAGHNQMEELMLVVEHCNRMEQDTSHLDDWAFLAYRCATSGQFGHWVKDFMSQKEVER
uniref:Odorant-binding protein 99d n=1 Tax=Drosophila melanogaster TaxID=7227 RepID=A9QK96_DROME|nr:odorant-binding protein 99d [Drosophila melanogaster]